jgi:hypothetical protein
MIHDDGIIEQGSISVSMSNRDLMNTLADHIQAWLLENVPAEVRLRVNWTIRTEFTVMDLRDRKVET